MRRENNEPGVEYHLCKLTLVRLKSPVNPHLKMMSAMPVMPEETCVIIAIM
jgi:hypothetical protein